MIANGGRQPSSSMSPASQVRRTVRQKSDCVALPAMASRSAVFRTSSTITLTRDRARRDLGSEDRDRVGHHRATARDPDRYPLTSGSLSPKFVTQRRRRARLSSANGQPASAQGPRHLC
jgi:hypothetical protein